MEAKKKLSQMTSIFHASFTVHFARRECIESTITLQAAGRFLALISHV